MADTAQLGIAYRGNAVQNRISSILSTSYSDLEIKNALQTLDSQKITSNDRKDLRLDLDQELVKGNGDVVKDFSQVAQVGLYDFI